MRSSLIALLIVLGCARVAAAQPVDAGADDELAEIEEALAADEKVDTDIDTAEGAPTWKEFVDNWDLFRDPVLAGGIAGLVLGFLSVYIVLRRMVFVSAAVTQAAGFGVALAFYAGVKLHTHVDPVAGATTLSLLTAALVAPDPRRIGLSREMVLGLCYAFFACATVIVSARIPQEAHDVQSILFGTAVAVSEHDMLELAGTGAFILILQLWWFRGFTFASFDPLAARVQGLPVRLLDVLLLVCIGVMVGESARALGALPAFALSVLPGVAAVQLARGPFVVTYVIGALIGAACGVLGYIAAFFLELPVGATQTALVCLVALSATLLAVAVRIGSALLRRRAR
jgi:zinc transport system permease protein